jgi:hypothetical protein
VTEHSDPNGNPEISRDKQTKDKRGGRLLFDRISIRGLLILTILLGVAAFFCFRYESPLIASILASLALTAFCLLVFKVGTYATEFFTAIRAMWLPVGVTVIAGILLFYEEQGLDLGVGLLGESLFKIAMLCPILIYWGLNNWHSARLGLNYAFTPTGEERWLFWSPRLLGVCAHLFAAISLAWASWRLVTAAGGSESARKPTDFLVFTAPAAIALVTLSIWILDVAFLSKNRKKPFDPKIAKVLVVVSGLLVVALFAGLWFAKSYKVLPEGLFAGTCSISASALVFLLGVSLRRANFSTAVLSHDALTIGLAVVAIAMAGFIWYSPTNVGDWLGSLNICFFAFGAVLAILNGFAWLGRFFIDRSVMIERVKFAALSIAFLLLLAALTSLLRDFHAVRLCGAEPCSSAPHAAWSSIPTVQDRPTVREAALAWYEQAAAEYRKDPGKDKDPVPLFIIATAGGGIRAAFWTATVLEKLQDDLKKDGRSLDKYLFAISGVSGGSVGAMNYIAALNAGARPTDYLKSDFLAPAIASLVFIDTPSNFLPNLGQSDRGTALERSFETGSGGNLSHSFLSFFPDKAASRTNWRPALLLNATHQETGRRIIGSNLKIERDTFLDTFDQLELLGSDMRASTAAHNSARFTYVSPAGKLVPKAGLGISPKIENRGYVIDGGYFENYGALTALELARSARYEIEKEKGRGSVKLVILQISSDPTLVKDRTRVRTREDEEGCYLTTAKAPATRQANYLGFVDSVVDWTKLRFQKNDGESVVVAYLNELAAPLIGVTAVREAHGTLAAAELASAVCVERDFVKAEAAQSDQKLRPAAISDPLIAKVPTTQKAVPTPIDANAKPHFAHLAMCEVSEISKAPIVPPLGWALSQPMRDKFSNIIDDCGNRTELDDLEKALK